MECKTIDGLLMEYINGDLPAEEEAVVKAHIKGCESCRREAERLASSCDKLRQFLTIAAGSADPPLDALLTIKQRAGIGKKKTERSSFGLHPALVGVALSFCTIILLLFTILPFFGGGAGPPLDPPAMVGDGTGGVYLYWQTGGREYEQHIDAEGNLLWGEGGQEITGSSPSFDISGGMDNAQDSTNYFCRINSIRFWYDSGTDTVYIQKENADEEHAWLKQRTKVYMNPTFNIVGYSNIISDGADGVIIASRATDGDSISSTYDIYALRIDSNGNWLWGESGLVVQRSSSTPTVLIIAGFSILVAGLLIFWLWRDSKLAKILIPVISLALFYIGMRSIWLMFMTSVGVFSDSWKFVLDTPLNGAAIWVIFITGFMLAVVGIKRFEINAWLILPVFLPYLLIAGIFVWFRIAALL